MSDVRTIAGVVDSAHLGNTLSHEHLTSGMAGMDRIPGLYDESEALRRSLDCLKRAHQAGYRTLIDCTPLDLGRQVSLFQKLAGPSPLHIIAATGVYRMIPLTYYSWDADRLAEFFISEICDGIEGTDIHAGIIKLAWDIEYQLDEGPRAPRRMMEKCARGAARAAKATGVPITCHTLANEQLGTPLLDIFDEEGLDLRAVTIGHVNDTDDHDYVISLAERGATVGLDRFFLSDPEYVERRSAVALALVKAGYADHTCLSHDNAAYGMNGGPATGGPRPENPDVWLRVPNDQLPWLRGQGVDEQSIQAMLQDSIRATFEAAQGMTG